jgi:NAD(P)-dependent dehydrogenase (short-subunit alcohol dehydrogenase family)
LWGLTGYGATKAAFDRLIEGLRDEHPEVRFVRAIIGSTIGTEFGAGFDASVLSEAFPRWVVTGQQTAAMMQPDELAAVVVDVLATLRANPGVEIPQLPLDPPGGFMTLPPTPEVAAKVSEALPGDD